jgi:hypothetical protein
MDTLIELFEFVWDKIEAAEPMEKRPQVSWKSQSDTCVASLSQLRNFPVSIYLETAIAFTEKWGHRRISKLLRQAVDAMVWSQNPSYSEGKLGSHFMKNYVFGQITGPGIPFADDIPPSGFLLLGTNTEYPAHSHKPREIYMVLSSGGEWRLDGKDWFSIAPGDVIYHAPNQIHAMRTQATPMLAFGAWLDIGNRNDISI